MYMLLCEVFRKVCSDNSKVSTFLHSNMFLAVVTFLLSCQAIVLTNHLTFSGSILVNRTSNGVVSSDDLLLTYKSIHQDVRAAVDWVHLKVSLLVYGKSHVLNPVGVIFHSCDLVVLPKAWREGSLLQVLR